MSFWLHNSLRYLSIVVGCFIASSAINLFLVPAQLLVGGLTGIAMIGYYIANWPIGVQALVYNIPLMIMSWKMMGRSYTVDVAVGTVIFSLMLDLTKSLVQYAPVQDMMLSTIYGGVFTGIGFGLIFRMNGSTGGLDILAAIARKYYGLNIGSVLLAVNGVIMLIASFLFGMAPAMFTMMNIFVNSNVVDRVIAGFNPRKAVLIISDNYQHIADIIINEIGRGVTFLHGQGAYTRRERNIIFVCVGTTQMGRLKRMIYSVDPEAFVLVISANEVMGRGFGQLHQSDLVDNYRPEVKKKAG